MKRRKKKKQLTEKQQKRQLLLLVILLEIVVMVGVASAYMEYRARPAALEEIWIADRGGDYITVAWKRVKNVDKYVVTYNGETVSVSGRQKQVKIEGLTPDTDYQISVRADSKDREGFEILEEMASTKKLAQITGADSLMKFTNRPVDLKQTAATSVTYMPGDGYKVTDDGRIILTKAGVISVTAKSADTEEYASTTKIIKVDAVEMVDTAASGSTPHTIYKLDKNNCECLMTIRGDGEIRGPQSFAYENGRYLIAYITNDSSEQRVISFGGEGKKIYKPELDLGHTNGFTIANGRCYSVRGDGKKTCITFDSSNSNFGSFDLAYGASGIAFDEMNSMFYTSSRKKLIAYDSNFNVVNSVDRVTRNVKYGVQDCGAYGGILMHCVSGEDVQATNYIDFYDMESSKYLGTIECELNEVESLVIDDEGYIVLLCNILGLDDFIWKTPINMKEMCG